MHTYQQPLEHILHCDTLTLKVPAFHSSNYFRSFNALPIKLLHLMCCIGDCWPYDLESRWSKNSYYSWQGVIWRMRNYERHNNVLPLLLLGRDHVKLPSSIIRSLLSCSTRAGNRQVLTPSLIQASSASATAPRHY